MEKINKKTMELIDGDNLMRCKVCGAEQLAQTIPNSNGRLRRGSWTCPKGCSIKEA